MTNLLTTRRESIKWTPEIRVIKYNPDTVRELTDYLGHEPTGPELRELERVGAIVPDDIAEAVGNSLVTAGLARLTNLITGGGGGAFNNAKGIIGVGNSNTATTVGMVDLQGASKYYEDLEAGSPSTNNGAITASALFGSADGNFAWEEWCFAIANNADVTPAATLAGAGGAGSVILNRKVASLGTKSSGASWTLQATVTLS
ncbi:hypothetical protein [Rhodococcus sp. 11-3]|uniref:hypothetical protein n=1 Tax=Rhodococcus sp. 11-3 TaxID=2854796 RepID=UPI00203FF54B|nr:hypothetical protein [Rhodococcus sp. 11-3]USC17027.1 hypothetical protein KZJ41_09245 [Rhodococcus sp. 11-3]